MSWAGLQLVTDADLGQIEPEAIATTSPWGSTTWPGQRLQAKRDLQVWLESDYGLGAADRVLDRHQPDQVFRYTGGTYADVRTAMSDDTEEDLDLAAVFATPATDRLYIGLQAAFDGLEVQLLDSLNAVASLLTAKYWGPDGWTALTMADGTRNSANTASLTQTGRLRWVVPANWERRRLNGTGDEYYWIELSVSAGLTAGTRCSQLLPTVVPEGLRLAACLRALGYIMRGLAAGAGNPEDWRTRGDRYLQDALAVYDRLKTSGALALDLNNSGAIEPTIETGIITPTRLRRG